MSGPLIQIPNLRPDPVHELEGTGGVVGGLLNQLGQQMAQRQQMQQLLMQKKGELALEQEKFQAEEQGRKEKKKQFADLGAQLSQALQGIGQPGTPLGAVAQSIPALASAGESGGAAAALRDVPQLAQQERMTNTQRVLGQAWADFTADPKAINDPIAQHAFLLHAASIDVGAAEHYANILKDWSGNMTAFVARNGDIFTVNHKETDPAKVVTRTGFNGGAIGEKGLTPAKLQSAATIAAQQLKDIITLVQKDSTADITPKVVAGLRGAKTGGGVIGALAGLAEPFAQGQLTPGQKQFGRLIDTFIPAFLPVLGGGSRGGQYLIDLIRKGVAPVAGQDETEVRADAGRIRANLLTLLTQMSQGKTVDMTQLIGFNAAAQAASDYVDPNTKPPAVVPAGPPQVQDFRDGVPPDQP
jgi:hypothetical protein